MARAADELSGADKLRTLYSAEFRFTNEGMPIVPVAIAQQVAEATISAEGGLRVLPEGDEGPEVESSDGFRVSARRTTAAKLRFWPVVFRGRASAGPDAAKRLEEWKARRVEARVFEQGTLFGVAGEVLDRREVVLGVEPQPSFELAERAIERLRARAIVPSGTFVELLERPHGEIVAVAHKGGLAVRNQGVIWFAPAIESPARPLRVEGKKVNGAAFSGSYHGRLYFTIGRAGDLVIVNAVPENRLLAGLVPAEIFPAAPDEALKAQAVAARGELLAKIGTRHTGDPFRLCAETHCQVYAGAAKETPRTTAAVEATRGEVLFSQGEARDLVDTVYSANCGGHTEHNEHAWADMPAESTLRGHPDGPPDAAAGGITAATLERFLTQPPPTYCGRAKLQGGPDRFRWTVTRSAAELDKLLADRKLGRIRAIEVTERGVSGRAKAITIVGALRSEAVRGELKIRRTFGNLRSSLFLVEVKDGAATFRGGGFGHGVGLCQTGATGMAESGKTYRDILRHYYTGSTLRKLW